MARKRDYPIIRFWIAGLYTLAVVMLIAGLAAGAYLWVRAEALRDGIILGGPLSSALHAYNSAQLCLGAMAAASGGLVGFLLLGAVAQLLGMQRDRAMYSATQVQLLEDILELNEELATSSKDARVEMCEKCGRLASVHRTPAGKWICRDCRRQLRSA